MTARPATRHAAASGGTLGQRIRARAIGGLSWLIGRLPERPLIGLAELGGMVRYRADSRTAAQVRMNLRRVAVWLAANELGPAHARAAATDPGALERLVRAAFRHHARYYLEVMRTPIMDARYVRERMLIETPDVVDEAFAAPGPVMFVGLHFGAIELPALFLGQRSGRPTMAPMETVGDPALQRWFVRTRGSVGIRIVGLREARRELVSALRRGELVGLVADRDLTGGGIDTQLFGAPAPLPAGPALLALETGATIYVASVRRAGPGRYRGRLERLQESGAASRRERVVEILDRSARAFERAIAEAPEQWWAVFFPIWPDLQVEEAAA
jgi:KDO2-lipid IV(A) lauroyltransferase